MNDCLGNKLYDYPLDDDYDYYGEKDDIKQHEYDNNEYTKVTTLKSESNFKNRYSLMFTAIL